MKLKPEKLFLPLSFLLPFSIYVYTLCPTVSVYADAGEAPTFAHVSGFIHPPGYPLFVLLVKLFQLLPFGNPAYQANLAAAFLSSLALSLLYLVLKQLKLKSLPSLAAVLILAFSSIYWRNALVSELFGLLAVFINLSLFLFLRWSETNNKKFLFGFILAAGFGFAHHQTMVFVLFPLLIYFIAQRQWRLLSLKDILLGLLLFLAGFLPYLYIYFIAAPRMPPMNWNIPSNLRGLMQLIIRSSYGTFRLTVGQQTTYLLSQITGLIKMVYHSFSLPATVLFAWGIFYSLKKNRTIWLYSFFVMLIALLFLIFSGMPVNSPNQIQYLERFQIISSIPATIIIAFGIAFLFQTINRLTVKPVRFLLISLIMLIPGYNLLHHWHNLSQKENYFADQLVNDIVRPITPNSIYIVEADGLINAFFYHRYVLNLRPDIKYIVAGILYAKPDWYLQELKHHYPDLVLPDSSLDSNNFLLAFIKLNSANRDVFFNFDFLENETRLFISKTRQGLVWQYFDQNKQSPPTLAEVNQTNLDYLNQSLFLQSPRSFSVDTAEYDMVKLYSAAYVFLAQINHDDLTRAEKYYDQALKLTPDNYLIYLELGDDYLMHQQPDLAVNVWQQALKYIKDEQLVKVVQDKISQQQ